MNTKLGAPKRLAKIRFPFKKNMCIRPQRDKFPYFDINISLFELCFIVLVDRKRILEGAKSRARLNISRWMGFVKFLCAGGNLPGPLSLVK